MNKEPPKGYDIAAAWQPHIFVSEAMFSLWGDIFSDKCLSCGEKYEHPNHARGK